MSERDPMDFSDLEQLSDLEPDSLTAKADQYRRDYPVTDEEGAVIDTLTHGAGMSQATHARYEEPCKACSGTGRFYGYSGRDVGRCFKCKGEGVRRFKTSPEARAQGRLTGTQRKHRKADALLEAVAAYRREHAELVTYLDARAPRWEFAQSLLDALAKWGRLTEGQEAAVERAMARDEAKATARARTGLDLRALPPGRYMVPGAEDVGLRFLVQAPDAGKWDGFIFVKDGSHYGVEERYGMQRPGGTYQGKHAWHLAAVVADPQGASARYGRENGQCGICNRPLENDESVARGIGPVCAAKYGW